MPGPDTMAELVFPLAGVDEAQEVIGQPPLTTAFARNVRAQEPETGRIRGGSRPGLSRDPDDLLPHGDITSGSRVIQHLALLIDPTTDATIDVWNTEYEPGQPNDANGVPDPSSNNNRNRNPGRYVRNGGDGRRPHARDVDPGVDSAPNYRGANLVDVTVTPDCGPAFMTLGFTDAFGPGLDMVVTVLLCQDSCLDAAKVAAAQSLQGQLVNASPSEAVDILGTINVIYDVEGA